MVVIEKMNYFEFSFFGGGGRGGRLSVPGECKWW